MKLKRPSLFIRTNFSSKLMKQDIENIIGLYKTKGYINAQISTTLENQKNNYINITYHINEGEKYFFNKLIIIGNKNFNNKFISSFFKNEISNELNQIFIKKRLLDLKKEYLKFGRLKINIIDEIILNENQATLQLRISEGKEYKINAININGLQTIKEKYVNRELLFEKNNIFNIVKINQTKKRIFESGLFSLVEIVPNIIDEKLGLVSIDINLREFKLSSIEADFGFSELTAWQNNLISPGIDVHGKWTIGNIYNTASNIIISSGVANEINFQSLDNKDNLLKFDLVLTYTSPWTFTLRLPTKMNFFYNTQKNNDLELERSGASYNLYWEKNASTRHDISITYETLAANESEVNSNNEPIRSIEYSYLNNKVKNIFSPSGGSFNQFKAILFGTFLGGKRNFLKATYEHRKYLNIFKRGIIAIRIKIGYIEKIKKDEYLPTYYLFELGGQSSLRGWSNPESFSKPKNKFELFNLEYRFPVYKKWGGELFYDAGSLKNTNKLGDYYFNYNYGMGITYDTAIGPIRLEYAIPNTKLNSKGTLHASILYIF